MNHRIAILSDIHGDTTALEAVIADARALGRDGILAFGDILLPGPGREDLLSCWMRFRLQQLFVEIGTIVSRGLGWRVRA